MNKKPLNAVLNVLNVYFKMLNSVVRFRVTENKSIEIIMEDRFVKTAILHLTYEFYTELENQLALMNLCKPNYNNNRTIFYCFKYNDFQWE